MVGLGLLYGSAMAYEASKVSPKPLLFLLSAFMLGGIGLILAASGISRRDNPL